MKNDNLVQLFRVLAGVCLATFAAAGQAETHTVRPAGMKFAPMIVYVEPGDRVVWRRMLGHNVETIDGMAPEGQEQFRTEIGRNAVKTFEEEGIIVYKCTPHWSSRMGGVIVVGDPENPEQVIDDYLSSIEENRSALPAKGLLKKLRRDMEENDLI